MAALAFDDDSDEDFIPSGSKIGGGAPQAGGMSSASNFSPAPPAGSFVPASLNPVPFQKIFKLSRFLAFVGDVDDDKKLKIEGSEIKVTSGLPKISSVISFFSALNALAMHLHSIGDIGFSWETWSTYISRLQSFVSVYSLESVLAFDREFRKWRRYHNQTWAADNSLLRDTILRVKQPPRTDFGAGTGKSDSRTKSVPVCRNWNHPGGCSLSRCRFEHKCVDCGSPDHPGHKCPRLHGSASPGGNSAH
jgi:hypothetical protein